MKLPTQLSIELSKTCNENSRDICYVREPIKAVEQYLETIRMEGLVKPEIYERVSNAIAGLCIFFECDEKMTARILLAMLTEIASSARTEDGQLPSWIQ